MVFAKVTASLSRSCALPTVGAGSRQTQKRIDGPPVRSLLCLPAAAFGRNCFQLSVCHIYLSLQAGNLELADIPYSHIIGTAKS